MGRHLVQKISKSVLVDKFHAACCRKVNKSLNPTLLLRDKRILNPFRLEDDFKLFINGSLSKRRTGRLCTPSQGVGLGSAILIGQGQN